MDLCFMCKESMKDDILLHYLMGRQLWSLVWKSILLCLMWMIWRDEWTFEGVSFHCCSLKLQFLGT